MTRLKNGRWLCLGRECHRERHSVYDAGEVIDPENEDFWAAWPTAVSTFCVCQGFNVRRFVDNGRRRVHWSTSLIS